MTAVTVTPEDECPECGMKVAAHTFEEASDCGLTVIFDHDAPSQPSTEDDLNVGRDA